MSHAHGYSRLLQRVSSRSTTNRGSCPGTGAQDIEAHLDIDPAKRPRRTLPSATRSINKRNPGPRQRTKATA